MKKCCFIVPYYGKLPDSLPIFLKSCEQNPDFTWLLLTDDTRPFPYPENVRVISNSLEDFKALAEKKFGFPVRIDRPYKLCDFKPAYGFLYEEYLTEFSFWGHCDLDVIMGKLGDHITDELLEQYDKLFCMGHMTLYRNTPENNRVFMSEHDGVALYRQVFTDPAICWFDEEYMDGNNVNQIFLRQGKRVYQKDLSLNISISSWKFQRIEYVGNDHTAADEHGYVTEDYRPALYYWDRGRLLRIWSRNGKLEQQDYLYTHLQYRKMRYRANVLSSNVFRLMPNRLLAVRAIPRSPLAVAFTPKSESIVIRALRAGIYRVKNLFGKTR